MKKKYIKPTTDEVLFYVEEAIANTFMGNSDYVPLGEGGNDSDDEEDDDYDIYENEQF